MSPLPAFCPHGGEVLLGLALPSCFSWQQARGESLNPFGKKQQLNLIQVCHFSPPERTNRFLLVWPHFKQCGSIASLRSRLQLRAQRACGHHRRPGLIPGLVLGLCCWVQSPPWPCWARGEVPCLPRVSDLRWRLSCLQVGHCLIRSQARSSQHDFYFTFQSTEERSGFSCES